MSLLDEVRFNWCEDCSDIHFAGRRAKCHPAFDVRELRRRLARALWRIRRERHFLPDGDLAVYSENLSNAMAEECHEMVMRRRARRRKESG
jgi:hypothetical protein